MSLFLNKEDGYFSLTTAGEVAVIILIAVLVILTAVISTRVKENKDQKKSPFSTKQLVFSAVALALGFVTSYIKIVNMPWGGSITLCSMLRIPVCMHNVPSENIFRPAAWNAFGMDKEGQDYRACAAYGPMYKNIR